MATDARELATRIERPSHEDLVAEVVLLEGMLEDLSREKLAVSRKLKITEEALRAKEVLDPELTTQQSATRVDKIQAILFAVSRSSDVNRFMAKVEVQPDGCWKWIGALRSDYSAFYHVSTSSKKRGSYGHRFSYEIFVGTIPDGLDLDHLCRNKACVNPLHLEAVTRSQNVIRAWKHKGLKATCKKGHPYDAVYGKTVSGQICTKCRNEYRRDLHKRKKQNGLDSNG